MRIKVKYESSEGPHQVDISKEDIEEMQKSGKLELTKKVSHENEKTISITGSKEELNMLAELLKKHTE